MTFAGELAPLSATYDVAVSFLAADEQTALALSDALAGAVSTFVFPERQIELAGADGVKELSRIYRRDSRVVVVLARPSWGQTKWTGIEETAITERGLDGGGKYDFLLWAPLEPTPPPAWLPSTRIWLDLQRYGVERLAGAVQERFRQLGGTPTIETPVERAARLRRERDQEAKRTAFLGSPQGVELATDHANRIFDEIDRQVEAIRQHVSVVCERYAHGRWLFHGGHTVSVHWRNPFANTLDGAVLVEEVHRGRVGARHYFHYDHDEPALVSTRRLRFNIDRAGHGFWETIDAPVRTYTSQAVAEALIVQAMDFEERS